MLQLQFFNPEGEESDRNAIYYFEILKDKIVKQFRLRDRLDSTQMLTTLVISSHINMTLYDNLTHEIYGHTEGM